MKMNKKGFTLIELLAVIVILAIIALIATPIVMNVINNAQAESNERSLESYAAQLELGYANAMLDAEKDTDAERIADAKTYANDNVKGTKPTLTDSSITMVNGKVTKIAAKYDNEDYCYQNSAATKGACPAS